MATFLDELDPLIQMKKFKDLMHQVSVKPLWLANKEAHQRRWDPYSFEGGTTAAIAGSNFVVMASDSRMSQNEINVLTREAERIHVLNTNICMITSGFHGDVLQMKRVLNNSLHTYRFNYRRDMSVDVCAELVARNLYRRRFFPLYTNLLIGGIDEDRRGALFDYDPVGCIERRPYCASGAGETIVMPFFDSQIGLKTLDIKAKKPDMTKDRAINLIKDAFRMVAEREIQTGDSINVVAMEAGKGQEFKKFHVNLRED